MTIEQDPVAGAAGHGGPQGDAIKDGQLGAQGAVVLHAGRVPTFGPVGLVWSALQGGADFGSDCGQPSPHHSQLGINRSAKRLLQPMTHSQALNAGLELQASQALALGHLDQLAQGGRRGGGGGGGGG